MPKKTPTKLAVLAPHCSARTPQTLTKTVLPLVPAVAAALTTAAKVLSGDNATAVLPQVTSLLAHRSDSVRKKALMTLHRFYQRNPSGLAHLVPKFRSMLCDKVRTYSGLSLLWRGK